jgi:hypothetical protein
MAVPVGASGPSGGEAAKCPIFQVFSGCGGFGDGLPSAMRRNSGEIPNDGERYRFGEPISTATAEATVSQVISRRMVSKQQMRWSPRGTHLLLQVRTCVLNAGLACWYTESPAQPSGWTSLPDLPRGRSPNPGPK